MRHLLLNAETISRKLSRMAYEIWERYSGEEEIIFLAIEQSGRGVAAALAEKLQKVSPLRVNILPLAVDKKAPLSPIHLPAGTDLNGKSVLLIDDVTNSGKTLFYALRPLMDFEMKSVAIAVLVDRRHKSFPMTPDVVGHTVATTLEEHIEVETVDGVPVAAYLR